MPINFPFRPIPIPQLKFNTLSSPYTTSHQKTEVLRTYVVRKGKPEVLRSKDLSGLRLDGETKLV